MADEQADAGAMGEKPTLPVEEKKTPDAKPDINTLLDKYGIKSSEDIEGVITELKTYKKGYGDRSNEVGELRRQIEKLQEQLTYTTQRPVGRIPPTTDPWSTEQPSNPEPIDLRREIKSSIKEFWEETQAQQKRAMDDYYRQRSEIESRPSWRRIGPVFDKALNTPEVRESLASGRITLDGLYSRLENRDLLNTVDNLVKQIPEGALKKSVAQTSETAERVTQPPPIESERKEKLKKAREKRDVDGVIKNLFDKNDPFLRP
jgi:hypothetical protein